MLRPVRDSDLATILAWRNQPANREVMNNRHVITAEEHAAWWESTKDDPTRQWLVFETAGTECGVVYFFDIDTADPQPHAMWGFYLDSEGLAGTGTALIVWNRLMREAIDHAFDTLGLEVLDAEVLEHNEAVRATNRRFGFVEGEPEERTVDDRTIVAIPISLHRANRKQRKRSS